jgi:hypothetical protein
VVNLIGDARVARISIGRGGAWLGALEHAFEPPVRVEEALAFAAPHTGGLRAICVELTSGACLWLGARFRFAFLESAEDAAARKATLRAEGARPPAPRVRAHR